MIVLQELSGNDEHTEPASFSPSSPFLFICVFTKQRSRVFEKWPERERQTAAKEEQGGRVLASHRQTQGATVLMGKGLQSCWWCTGAPSRRWGVRVRGGKRWKEEKWKGRKRKGSEKTLFSFLSEWGQPLTKCSAYPLPLMLWNLRSRRAYWKKNKVHLLSLTLLYN